MVIDSLNLKIRLAALAVQRGGVVAYPTEAVWGLGCDPFNPDAVRRVLELKNRACTKGLILIAAGIDQLEPFLTGINRRQREILQQSWPGPNTWLVPNNGVAPCLVSGGRPTLALRVTGHPVAAALCRAVSGPVVSTSANPQGLAPARSALKVRCYFKDGLDAILPGAIGGAANPTVIRDLETGQVVRPA